MASFALGVLYRSHASGCDSTVWKRAPAACKARRRTRNAAKAEPEHHRPGGALARKPVFYGASQGARRRGERWRCEVDVSAAGVGLWRALSGGGRRPGTLEHFGYES